MTTAFGDRVKLAREHAGLTQGQLASKVGMTQGQISKLELGVRKKSTKTFAISLACNVKAYWLETGEGPMGPLVADEALQQSTTEKRRLSDGRQDEVQVLLERVNEANRPLVLALLRAAIDHNMPLSPAKPVVPKRAIVGAPVTPTRTADEQRSKSQEQGEQRRRRSG